MLPELRKNYDMGESKIAAKIAVIYADALIEGYKEATPKWIPCSERLPSSTSSGEQKLSPKVLTCKKNGVIKLGYYDYDLNYFIDETMHYYLDDVTHWMPLPERPKERDE